MTTPLVPSECDLRDSKYMPMFVQQMLNSSFNAMADDTAWRAGVTLWMRAWLQVPAASLPDDDEELCQFAGLGRDMRTWRKIREKALRGWTKCDDGRLYHALAAEAALEAWIGMLLSRISSGAGNAKKWGGDFDGSDIERQIGEAYPILRALNPRADGIKKLDRRNASGRKPKSRNGTDIVPPGYQPDIPPGSQPKPEPKPEYKGSRVSNETLSPFGASVPEGSFEEFRSMYPKPDGLTAAMAKWDAAVASGDDPQSILSGLKAWLAKWHDDKTAQRWIPKAATWLENRQWLDLVGGEGASTQLVKAWTGPKAIRDAVVIETGEPSAVSYVDTAEWEEPGNIITATAYAADKLKQIARLKSYTISVKQKEKTV